MNAPRIAGSASGRVTRSVVRSAPAPEGARRVLHLGGDEVEGGAGEHEHVREGVAGDHQHQARLAVDVEGPRLRRGEGGVDAIEPARVGSGHEDPRHRAQVVRHDERAEHRGPHQALGRHVGARDRPRHRHPEDGAEQRHRDADHQRVDEGLHVPPAPVGGHVVLEGEGAGLRMLEAGPQQSGQRVDHEQEQQRDQQQPDDVGALAHGAAPVRCRRSRGTAPSPPGCPSRSRPRWAGWSSPPRSTCRPPWA